MVILPHLRRFERIRRAHQKEVAEDYVEMIAELITRFGEAEQVIWRQDSVSAPTVNATIQRLQREGLVVTVPYQPITLLLALAKNVRVGMRWFVIFWKPLALIRLQQMQMPRAWNIALAIKHYPRSNE